TGHRRREVLDLKSVVLGELERALEADKVAAAALDHFECRFPPGLGVVAARFMSLKNYVVGLASAFVARSVNDFTLWHYLKVVGEEWRRAGVSGSGERG